MSLWALPVRADDKEIATCVARLDEASADELLTFTAQSLRDQRLGAALWYSGWMAFNTTIVSVGAYQAATTDSHVGRDVWMLSSIGAGIFVLGAAIMPLPALYANLRMSRLPEVSAQDRRAKLRRGLDLLASAAAAEDRNSNLTAHLGALFYGLFSAGFIYFHNPHASRHDVAVAASVQLIATMAGAEATLWSVPRKARRDWASAKKRACGQPAAASAPRESPARALSLALSPLYFGLRARF